MKTPRHQAMTLIEILIAIGVFAVGVLSIMRLVTSNIHTTDQISKNTEATMLATQGLELLYQTRNSNSYKEVERDCYKIESSITRNTVCQERLSDLIGNNNALKISLAGPHQNTYSNKEKTSIGSNSQETFRLYRHTDSSINLTYFDHNPNNGTKTPYARYITVEKFGNYPTTTHLKITSHVLISQGTSQPKKVTISTVIGKIIE